MDKDARQDFLLTEYHALREEILKRTEIQHQLISLALIAAGSFLTFNVTTAILAYPILALFISAAWKQSDNIIASLGAYIRKRVEEVFLGDNLGWEHYYAVIRDPSFFGSLAHFASRGILGGSQVVTFIVGLLKTEFPPEDVFLLVLDFVAIVLTQILLSRRPVITGESQPTV